MLINSKEGKCVQARLLEWYAQIASHSKIFIKNFNKKRVEILLKKIILMLNVNKLNKLDLSIFAFSPLFYFVIIFSAEFHEKIQDMFTHVAHIKVLISSWQFILKKKDSNPALLPEIRQLINIVELNASLRCSDPPAVSRPCEDPHYDHHDWQSHTEHNTADGEVDRTIRDGGRNQILSKGRVFKQKGRSEVQKHLAAPFFGVYLTPPLPVVVLHLQGCHQSDVAASVANQLISGRDHQRDITQLLFIQSSCCIDFLFYCFSS